MLVKNAILHETRGGVFHLGISTTVQFVSFDLLRARLLKDLRRRLNNGEFTERSLGRELGISQTQVHNVLKGARTLQPSLADRIMQHFQISVSGLLSNSELEEELRVRRAAGQI